MASGAMACESALVFDVAGAPLYWHVPAGRSAAAIPDSRTLWEVLWAARATLGGVAHTHPGKGAAAPSPTDVTTFAACEAALGKRLVWVIVSDDDVAQLAWVGPEAHGYRRCGEVTLALEHIERLRQMNQEEAAT